MDLALESREAIHLNGTLLATSIAMATAVFLAHVHDSIGAVGAWADTFTIFAMREWRPRERAAGG